MGKKKAENLLDLKQKAINKMLLLQRRALWLMKNGLKKAMVNEKLVKTK